MWPIIRRYFERVLVKIAEKTKRTGVVYIGGGVPKDTIQLSTIIKSLYAGGEDETPHEYAIQITTDSPQWGGLSGCTLEEAISWGKIAPGTGTTKGESLFPRVDAED